MHLVGTSCGGTLDRSWPVETGATIARRIGGIQGVREDKGTPGAGGVQPPSFPKGRARPVDLEPPRPGELRGATLEPVERMGKSMDSRTVAGYLRVSKARDGMLSPEIYQEQIEKYCTYKGLKLGEIYSDLDYSGFRKGSRTRPALMRLVDERVRFSMVVVPKLSRFGRDLMHLTELFALFDKDNISLVFLDLGLDTSSSQGRLLRNIMGSIAEYESDVKSDYARANARHIASTGRTWSGAAPFGYSYSKADKNFYPLEEEARYVREMFARLIAGEGMQSISRWLEGEQVPTRKGGSWSLDAVRRMCDNPAYVGLRPYDGQLITALWEPLIDMDTWRSACERREEIKARFRHTTSANKNVNYLLRSVISCGICGKRLVHRPNNPPSRGLYACPDSGHFSRRCPGGGISTERAEDMVVKALRNRFWFAFADDLRVRHERLADLESRWSAGDTDERRSLLQLAISRVILVPRTTDQAKSTWIGTRRQLRIIWADGWEGLEGEREELVPRSTPGVTKWCSNCAAELPITDFNRDGSNWDGHMTQCRSCVLALRRAREAGLPKAEGRISSTPKPHTEIEPKGLSWAEFRRREIAAR